METIPGAGGARFTPYMTKDDAKEFVDSLVNAIDDETRVLPGGYVYLSDILGQPGFATHWSFDCNTIFARANRCCYDGSNQRCSSCASSS